MTTFLICYAIVAAVAFVVLVAADWQPFSTVTGAIFWPIVVLAFLGVLLGLWVRGEL